MLARFRMFTTLLVACLSFPLAVGAQTPPPRLLWYQFPDATTATVPSYVSASPVADVEAVDDFDIQGTVQRLVFEGTFSTFAFGVSFEVRFYAWNAGAVGALLQQQTLTYATGASANGGRLDLVLPTPFTATGKHWVSVRPISTSNLTWSARKTNVGAATLGALRTRNNLGGGAWTIPAPTADLAFMVLGTATGLPPAAPDPCGEWSALATPDVAGSTTTILRDIAVLSPYDAWAVGQRNATIGGSTTSLNLAMHWDGNAWSNVTVPNPTSGTANPNCILYTVAGTGSNDVWAAGNQRIQLACGWTGQQVLIMHFDGSSWTVMPNTPLPFSSCGGGASGATVHDMTILSQNDIWFVGRWIEVNPSSFVTTHSGLMTHWNGSTFTQVNLPVIGGLGGQVFNAVDADGPNEIWAVGEPHTGNSSIPVIYRYDGSNWSSLAPPTLPGTVKFLDVDVVGTNEAYVLGQLSPASGSPITFIWYWDGVSWTFIPGPPWGASSLVARATSDIVVGGVGIWNWDGVQWTQRAGFTDLSPTGASISRVEAVSSCDLWASGSFSGVGGIKPFTARIDSAGYAWTHDVTPCVPTAAPAVLDALNLPRVGTNFFVGVASAPGQWSAANAVTYWLIGLLPPVAFPCGDPVALGGSGGTAGELLFRSSSFVYSTPPVLWPVGGPAAQHGIALPSSPVFIGFEVWTQAVLVNLAQPTDMLLTNGLLVHLGQ